jgi:hypothetical protein
MYTERKGMLRQDHSDLPRAFELKADLTGSTPVSTASRGRSGILVSDGNCDAVERDSAARGTDEVVLNAVEKDTETQGQHDGVVDAVEHHLAVIAAQEAALTAVERGREAGVVVAPKVVLGMVEPYGSSMVVKAEGPTALRVDRKILSQMDQKTALEVDGAIPFEAGRGTQLEAYLGVDIGVRPNVTVAVRGWGYNCYRCCRCCRHSRQSLSLHSASFVICGVFQHHGS